MSDAYIDKKHILAISNDPRILAEIKMCLTGTYDVSIAATSAAALAALVAYSIDAIIISIGDSFENAFSVYTDISGFANRKNLPVLFVSEQDNGDDENQVFSAGAADYAVRRPGSAAALLRRIDLRISASENEYRISLGDSASVSEKNLEMMLEGKTILVVDDVELNRDLIEGMLCEIDGLSLDFAADGQEAVEKFAKEPDRFSLILMDVQMPVMSGTDATRTIRSLAYEKARTIPIIALTAGVEERETTSYLEAGMNDFLQKPMNYDQLCGVVYKYVR